MSTTIGIISIVAAFALLIVLLLVKPSGLFGGDVQDKA